MRLPTRRGAFLAHPAKRVRRRFAARVLPCAVALLALQSPGFAAEAYLSAAVDQAGQLRIVTGDGRAIIQQKDTDQVGFDQVAISSNGRSVGWVALYPNCCTSYP